MNRLNQSLRATFIGMGTNVALAGLKLWAGIVGHSHALIADAIESMADLFAGLVVWRGLIVASTPADREHPYGHGKAEPIAAAIVAGMLIAAAVAIAYRSAAQLMEPRQPPEAYTLWVLLTVIAVKEGLFRIVSRTANSVKSIVVHTDAWHHRSDAITSAAAAIGIAVAILGGPGFEVADDIAAMVAAWLIGWNGLRLLRPALNELMDTAPDQELISQIKQVASGVSGVRLVEKCIVRKMGYHYYVDMHVEVDPEMTVQAGHAIAHHVKSCVREQIPTVHDVLVHIEPEKKTSNNQRPPSNE